MDVTHIRRVGVVSRILMLSINIVLMLLNLYVDTRMVQLICPDACSKLLKLSWIRPLTFLSSELTFWTITPFGHLVRLRDGRSVHRKVSNYITEEREHTHMLREFKPAIPRQGGSWSNVSWTTLTLPSL